MTTEEFKKCIDMIRSDDAMTYENGYLWIQDYINDYFDDLVYMLKNEVNLKIRAKFVELVGDSMSEKAIPVLTEELTHACSEVRRWAWVSLISMEIPEATKIAAKYRAKYPGEEFYP